MAKRKHVLHGRRAMEVARARGSQIGTPKRRPVGVNGALQCWRCRKLKDPELFPIDRSRPSGRHSRCRRCDRILVQRRKKLDRARERALSTPTVPVFIDGPLGTLPPREPV